MKRDREGEGREREEKESNLRILKRERERGGGRGGRFNFVRALSLSKIFLPLSSLFVDVRRTHWFISSTRRYNDDVVVLVVPVFSSTSTCRRADCHALDICAAQEAKKNQKIQFFIEEIKKKVEILFFEISSSSKFLCLCGSHEEAVIVVLCLLGKSFGMIFVITPRLRS
jgi:hypothetical protein